MTQTEALKLALEALNLCPKDILFAKELKQIKSAITAIKEALAQPEPLFKDLISQHEGLAEELAAIDSQPEQEPVAVKHMMEWVDYLKRKSDYGQHLQIPSEMSAGACWDLARELEQFITTPPQRTWVGLSEEQKRQLNESLNLQGRFPIIEAIEAICKGNNT